MAEKELKAALAKLAAEVDNIDQNDKESRVLLKQLIESINVKLSGPGGDAQREQLMGKIKSEAIHFEVKHPLISSTLEEIVAILVRLGI